MSTRYQQAEEELEGFQQMNQDNEDNFIILKNLDETQYPSNNNQQKHLSKGKARFLIKEKPKIKFTALERLPLTSRKKGDSQKCMKSMSLQKTVFEQASNLQLAPKIAPAKVGQEGREGRSQSMDVLIEAAIVQTKRGQVGEDLIIRQDENQQLQKMKQIQHTTIYFQKRLPKGTHELFSRIGKYCSSSFLKSKYNSLLRSKMDKYQLKGEEDRPKYVGEVSFEANAESSNLQYVGRGEDGQYNLILSVDTNTRGHQGWFYFTLVNNQSQKQVIKLNICNLKRRFPMVKKGQRVYRRRKGQWQCINDVSVETSQKGKHKMSFQVDLDEQQRVEISLLPPYTYSHQLQQAESYEAFPNARVEILTYSLAGLAVPLITITKGAQSSNQPHKNRSLYLLTARIHPSETCSSFIVNSLIQELLNNGQYQQFLKKTVLKIVPMVNPDGVVFGNFRTNYLGADLNRSFNCNDQTLFPQIVAVKQLGRKCKEEYGANFLGFLDLHGHSSQPNSFIYGPEYPASSDSFVECRILPKILDRVSNIFHYNSSSFKLQEYKNNTARGFFFRKLKVPAYTIQTSYALYSPKEEDQEQTLLPLGIEKWEEFGRAIASAIKINYQCITLSQEKGEKKSKKRVQSHYQNDQSAIFARLAQSKAVYAKLRRQILQQIKNEDQEKKASLEMSNRAEKEEVTSEGESDGEGEEEDLSPEEQSIVIKRLSHHTSRGKSILPRVSKEPTLATSLSPSLIPTFYIGNDAREGILQRINSKFRNFRHNRPVNISQEYTEYLLRNITGVTSLRPQIVSFNPKISKPSYSKPGEA